VRACCRGCAPGAAADARGAPPEYKHKPNQPAGVRERPGTVIFKEYSVDEGDPYYPVPNPDNQALFEKYRDLAAKEPGVLFVGRLASYKCAPAMRRRAPATTAALRHP
jgi:UDP-galactopyranose mutase